MYNLIQYAQENTVMIYPEFLKPGDTIGICAPSAGVGRKLESFDRSLAVLKENGWKIRETASVRINNVRSASPAERAAELKELFADPDIDFAACAAGGDFLYEILPYVDWEFIAAHPKWLMGMSDPTSLLFTLTAKYDLAAVYGMNAGSFDTEPFHPYMQCCLDLISGKNTVQHSYDLISSNEPFSDEPEHFDRPSRWESTAGDITVEGRCIGGCIDVLKDLIGTPYDGTKKFIKKYQDDGIIWFFDNFSLGAEVFYRTLLQMKYAGWFEHTNAVLMGRVLFESSDTGMTYEDALKKALPGIPVVYQADVGHTLPHMTLIMGSVMNLKYAAHKGSISFQLR